MGLSNLCVLINALRWGPVSFIAADFTGHVINRFTSLNSLHKQVLSKLRTFYCGIPNRLNYCIIFTVDG
jgi:hypothetical protein